MCIKLPCKSEMKRKVRRERVLALSAVDFMTCGAYVSWMHNNSKHSRPQHPRAPQTTPLVTTSFSTRNARTRAQAQLLVFCTQGVPFVTALPGNSLWRLK